MTWFWFALAAPALYALSNHVDKYLLIRGANDDKRESQKSNIAVLVLYSSFIAVFVLPVLLIFGVMPMNGVTPVQVGALITGGLLGTAALLAYLYALEKDHASVVVPLFQFIPIFVLVLSYIFLGEKLTITQLIGFFVVFAGSFLLTIEYENLGDRKIHFKTSIVLLMMAANILVALNAILYKWVVVDTAFFPAMFWEYVGMIAFGFGTLLFSGVYRTEMARLIRGHHIHAMTINTFNEILYIAATFCVRYAAITVPIALVNVMNGFQPVFILIFGWLFTKFVPGFITEDISRRHMIQKVIAIVVIVSGGVLINM